MDEIFEKYLKSGLDKDMPTYDDFRRRFGSYDYRDYLSARARAVAQRKAISEARNGNPKPSYSGPYLYRDSYENNGPLARAGRAVARTVDTGLYDLVHFGPNVIRKAVNRDPDFSVFQSVNDDRAKALRGVQGKTGGRPNSGPGAKYRPNGSYGDTRYGDPEGIAGTLPSKENGVVSNRDARAFESEYGWNPNANFPSGNSTLPPVPSKSAAKPVTKASATSVPMRKGETVSGMWTRITGLPWKIAKEAGYTDGGYNNNIALLKKLRSGEVTKDSVMSYIGGQVVGEESRVPYYSEPVAAPSYVPVEPKAVVPERPELQRYSLPPKEMLRYEQESALTPMTPYEAQMAAWGGFLF